MLGIVGTELLLLSVDFFIHVSACEVGVVMYTTDFDPRVAFMIR